MDELAGRMAAGVARVRGRYGDAAAATRRRLDELTPGFIDGGLA